MAFSDSSEATCSISQHSMEYYIESSLMLQYNKRD